MENISLGSEQLNMSSEESEISRLISLSARGKGTDLVIRKGNRCLSNRTAHVRGTQEPIVDNKREL